VKKDEWSSFPYLAPEVVKNLGTTALSDVWSVGAMSVYMLTGACPWQEHGTKEAIFKKITGMAVPPLPFGITVSC
jgi:serine/threonine protein kinase